MKRMITGLFVLVVFQFQSIAAVAAVPNGQIPYYGAAFFQEMNKGLSDRALVQTLNVILKSRHTVKAGDFDTIYHLCQGQPCFVHTALGYNNARKYLMGEFYLIKTNAGYGMRDLYCDHDTGPSDYTHGEAPGPGQIPDHNVVNTEHTWPQSRFSGSYPNETQKSDLHHLFPTDNEMNSVRGSFPFGEVAQDKKKLKCSNVRFGTSEAGDSNAFEPPESHKGNVARALFYFSTRYDLRIDPKEEGTLRAWHKADPVDEEEARLNNRIFELQFNRNPYIDYPTLVDRVKDF
jgi:deoxyribonuclease-1